MLKLINKNTKVIPFNITSLTKWLTTLPTQSITQSPTFKIMPTIIISRDVTTLKKNSPTQTLLRTTNSTLQTIIGKEQEGRVSHIMKSDGNIKEDKVVKNSLDGLIIEFKKAIQEEEVEKLLTTYHSLKEQKGEQGIHHLQQNYLTKTDYQSAINLLLCSTNN